jgi:FkbM family methyltransferase
MQFDLLRAMGYGDSDVRTNGEARALASALAGRRGVVVDVGANRGDFTARALQLGASVLAFEPSPAAFAGLERRFAGASHVRLFPVGLSDRNEDSAMLRAPEPGSTHGSLYGRVGIYQTAVESVVLRRLDEMLDALEIETVDFLKVDAEGHDVAVLSGAGMWVDGVRTRAIQFEHGGTAPDARVFLRDFFDVLTPAYRIHRILPDGLWPLERYSEVEEVTLYANYLALPA